MTVDPAREAALERLDEAWERFEAWDFEAAESLCATLPELDDGAYWSLRGLLCERRGAWEEAERWLRQAGAYEGFVAPCRVADEVFDGMIERALEELPEELRQVVAECCEVRREDLPEEGSPMDLGLCVGELEDVRSGELACVEIILYRRSHERSCGSVEELEDELRRTLWHELGHALGLDEDGVAAWGLA